MRKGLAWGWFATSEKVLNLLACAPEVPGPDRDRLCNGGWIIGDKTIEMDSNGFDTYPMESIRNGMDWCPLLSSPLHSNG